jgi:hypothetical protein
MQIKRRIGFAELPAMRKKGWRKWLASNFGKQLASVVTSVKNRLRSSGEKRNEEGNKKGQHE